MHKWNEKTPGKKDGINDWKDYSTISRRFYLVLMYF
jgi:hypothetical protein